MYQTKLEKYKIVEMRKGRIYKTEKVDEDWFEVGKTPECYVSDGVVGSEMWVATNDYRTI